MYNLSQFVKTLKERVSMWYNEEHGHSGGLSQGRFYSVAAEWRVGLVMSRGGRQQSS